MEFCAFSILDAVRWPGPALGLERHVIWRMPISCGVNLGMHRREQADVLIEDWDYLVSFRNWQSASRKEIILNISDNQRVVFA
jgi:hypothetical protein